MGVFLSVLRAARISAHVGHVRVVCPGVYRGADFPALSLLLKHTWHQPSGFVPAWGSWLVAGMAAAL